MNNLQLESLRAAQLLINRASEPELTVAQVTALYRQAEDLIDAVVKFEDIIRKESK
ncbi:MAG TPA: hypothetical protein VII92_04390 [Anaerolineae bacterium]